MADICEVKQQSMRHVPALLEAKVQELLKQCKELRKMKLTLGCLPVSDM